MRVSYNELLILTSKCFNSLNLPIGEVDRIAHMVADLELVGYTGLEFFLQSLDNISQKPNDISISQTNANTIDVDLQDSSVVLHLPVIMYYARQKLGHQDSITINIHKVHNRWLAYGEIKKISERGYCVSANWSRRGVEQKVHYILNKNAPHPDLYLIDEQATDDVLQVHISRKSFEPPKPTIKTRHISAYNLSIEREKSVSNGVKVNDEIWSTLTNIAKNNLVENSDISEKLGAGGS